MKNRKMSSIIVQRVDEELAKVEYGVLQKSQVLKLSDSDQFDCHHHPDN